MLARRMSSILPELSREEALEVTKIYSIAGLLPPNGGLITRRPFRSPHHTTSMKEIECCRKAIELDPNFAKPWNNMGSVYGDLGDYNKEIECYRKAIELDPKLASPWHNMGFAYGNLGDYPKAVECFRKAVELEPGNKGFQKNLEAAKKKL